METYTAICLQDGKMCFKKIRTLTAEEKERQMYFWNVRNIHDLIARWNSQPESNITKLKWVYYLGY